MKKIRTNKQSVIILYSIFQVTIYFYFCNESEKINFITSVIAYFLGLGFLFGLFYCIDRIFEVFDNK